MASPTHSFRHPGRPTRRESLERTTCRRTVANRLERVRARRAGAHDVAGLQPDGLARHRRHVARAGARHRVFRRVRVRRLRRLPGPASRRQDIEVDPAGVILVQLELAGSIPRAPRRALVKMQNDRGESRMFLTEFRSAALRIPGSRAPFVPEIGPDRSVRVALAPAVQPPACTRVSGVESRRVASARLAHTGTICA
jgi:hypothetical protein